MTKRSTSILSTLALASSGLVAMAAQAEADSSERCLDAAAKGDAEQAAHECARAAQADPENERVRVALSDAQAELARAKGPEDPAKLNQH